MTYPSVEEVVCATHVQLARWWRFLPSPGADAAMLPSIDEFWAATGREARVLALIAERFHEMGGMTPAVSRWVGWSGQEQRVRRE